MPTYPKYCKIIWCTVVRVKLFTTEELLDLWDVTAFACLDYPRFGRYDILRSQCYFREQWNGILDQKTSRDNLT